MSEWQLPSAKHVPGPSTAAAQRETAGVREGFLEEVALGLGLEDGRDVSTRWVVGWESTAGTAGAKAPRWGGVHSPVGLQQRLWRDQKFSAAPARSLDVWSEGEWEPRRFLSRGGEGKLLGGGSSASRHCPWARS